MTTFPLSPWHYNQQSLGRRWHLIDLPIAWPGYQIIATTDVDDNLVIDHLEESYVDWFAFTQCVTQFQQEHSLTPIDGKLGPNTLKTLQRYYNREMAPSGQHSSNEQPSLITLGPDFSLLPATHPTAEPNFLLPSSAHPTEQSIVNLWNHYGGAIIKAAKSFKLSIKTCLAVFQVESKKAYDPATGLILIRFEPHIFKRYTGKNVAALHKNQSNEWHSLQEAYALDAEAALLSTSYGLPQLMGFNWKVTTFNSVKEMVLAYQDDCEQQVLGFFEFVSKNNLISAIKDQHWAKFVSGYNGPGNVPVYTQRLNRAMQVVNFYDTHYAFNNQTGDLFERIV